MGKDKERNVWFSLKFLTEFSTKLKPNFNHLFLAQCQIHVQNLISKCFTNTFSYSYLITHSYFWKYMDAKFLVQFSTQLNQNLIICPFHNTMQIPVQCTFGFKMFVIRFSQGSLTHTRTYKQIKPRWLYITSWRR